MKNKNLIVKLGVLFLSLCLTFALVGCDETQAETTPDNASETMSIATDAPADVEEMTTDDMLLPPAAEEMTAEQALENYMAVFSFSRQSTIEHLEGDGFSTEEATAAVDAAGIDWNEQAVKQAQSYLETMEFTRDELIGQLEADQFTPDEAVYGVDNCGQAW